MKTLTKSEELIIKGFSLLSEDGKNAFLAYATLMNVEADVRSALELIEQTIKVIASKERDCSKQEQDESETLSDAEIALLIPAAKNTDGWTEQEWTEYPTFNAVDVNSSDDGGYIYAAEYGEYIKIGYTVSPKSRLGNHAATAKNYGNITTGRVLLSPPHKTYQKTEKLLHEYFKAYRKDGTELFEVSFDELKAQIRDAIREIQEEAK